MMIDSKRPWTGVLLPVLLVLLTIVPRLSADDPKPKKEKRSPYPFPSIDPSDLKMNSTRAANLAGNEHATKPEFHERLENLLDSFAEGEVTVNDEELKWKELTLNKEKYRFGGIRFQSPLDGPADFYLIFSSQPAVTKFSLYPMRGAFPINSITYHDTSEFDEVDLPDQEKVAVLKLGWGKIHPDIDYVLWFLMDHEKPVELKYAIRLVPYDGPGRLLGRRESLEELLEVLQFPRP